MLKLNLILGPQISTPNISAGIAHSWRNIMLTRSERARHPHHVPFIVPAKERVDVRKENLLEDFPVSPLVGLPVGLDRLVPSPLVLHELAIFLDAGVKLDELVALIVRRDIEGGYSFVATGYESASDDRIPSHAVHGQAAEEVFARSFETGEETT